MTSTKGYFATDRAIFDHWIARNPKHFQAWQWMIADAAHTPRDHRGAWGVVSVERGQLVASVRILASRWRWSKSSVARFLGRLKRDGMIALKKCGTASGTPVAHEITIITICNYNSFQKASTRAKPRVGQQVGLHNEEKPTQSLLFSEFSPTSTTKPLNLESIVNESMNRQIEAKASPERNDPPTKHGRQSSKHKTVFLLKGTEEWRIHAADYREIMGAEPLPNRHGGFWFYAMGEANRPNYQRGWRNAKTGQPSQTYATGTDFSPSIAQSDSHPLPKPRSFG